jgi:4-diphosphocytidyl-2-C-methyl-D-erythritol kinase
MSLHALYDVPAPAKLNLFLHVVGRRADGYHLLQSVFVLVDWCDTLHFERRTDGRLQRHDLGPALPAEEPTFRSTSACRGPRAWGAAVPMRPAPCWR